MSVSSTRKTQIVFTGDVDGTQEYEAATNDTSPGTVQVVELSPDSPNGTTIILPDFGITELDARCVTIIKPAGNTADITLKGNSGVANADGIKLHPTDPDSLTFKSTVESFVLHATDVVVLRLVWT
jgi:hypothetical protein